MESFSHVPSANKIDACFLPKDLKIFFKVKDQNYCSYFRHDERWSMGSELSALRTPSQAGKFVLYTDGPQPACSQAPLPLPFCLPHHLSSLPLPPQPPSALHSSHTALLTLPAPSSLPNASPLHRSPVLAGSPRYGLQAGAPHGTFGWQQLVSTLTCLFW